MAATTPAAGAGGNDAGTRGTTMKAIVQHRYGSPGVLALEEIAIPAAGDDEVLIRVRAAGLNAGDGFIMRGVPYFMLSSRSPLNVAGVSALDVHRGCGRGREREVGPARDRHRGEGCFRRGLLANARSAGTERVAWLRDLDC